MRIRRLAVLSGVAAAIGGALWWKKAREADEMEDDTMLLDLSSTNGRDSDEAWDATESELSL